MRVRAARLAALAGLLLSIALASTAAGATASVTIEGFAFTPASLTINAGDTVTWTNRDQAAHSAAFAGGGPRTQVLANGASASITFGSAGTFNYVCGIHGASMSGTVVVRAAAAPLPTPLPTVRQTAAPTIAPTVEPTPEPTARPSPIATPAPTTAAPSATAQPTIAVAAPSERAPAGATSNDGGSASALVVGAALLATIAVLAFAWRRIRR